MTRRSLVAALVLALSVPALSMAQTTASLTILHTNDTHGHLLPFSYPTVVAQGSEEARLKEKRNIGGIARRATLAAAIRADLARKKIPVWLIDAGDFSDGTPFSTEYHGEADVAAMNAAGYNFATIGNHEFNNPMAQTRKLVGLAKYPILMANAVDRATRKPIGQPWRIEKIGTVRVGLFGMVTREAAPYPAGKEGIDVLDEIATAKDVVKTLRSQADIVILISHCGEELDNRLAAEVPGLDVIVGGHSHSRLPVGEFVWHSDDLKVDDVNGTIIVQAFQWGGELGRLDLLFRRGANGSWSVDRYRERLLPITEAIAADPTVAAVVDKFWQPIAQRFGQVVGQAVADFSTRGDDEAPYNLVADAVREMVGAEFELENVGGVRAPLVSGPITRADLVTMDPFDNTVITFKATGRQIRDILSRYTPYVSGLRYRLVSGKLADVTINGQPLDDEKTYAGATNSYFAGVALKGITQENTGRNRLDVVTEYVKKKGSVEPAYDGRRVIIGSRR
ncbi:MAG: bifunctional UDP-sugar hydrolase/5'-nucleotidase [Acidobacteria bacterium]|nr:bifunctional UDP-sugar hydrolase/5'-nucleotidase [Acidobacteriota bacterium]